MAASGGGPPPEPAPGGSATSPVRPLEEDLADELAGWPVGSAGVVVVDRRGVLGRGGDVASAWPWASVTKLLSALTVLRAVADGTVGLEDPAGPPGATLRHLLAHASGLSMESDRPLTVPARRRVYTNRGIELAVAHVEERTGVPAARLVTDAVLEPLGMAGTALAGSPAHGAMGPVQDLGVLAAELLEPTVLPAQLVAEATTVAYPGLAGVLPGFGRQEPNDWGLGFEVRGSKDPHWTSERNSPRTFGHFGQSGAFLWVDPEAGVGCASAGDTPFGPWAARCWPALSARVLSHVAGR